MFRAEITALNCLVIPGVWKRYVRTAQQEERRHQGSFPRFKIYGQCITQYFSCVFLFCSLILSYNFLHIFVHFRPSFDSFFIYWMYSFLLTSFLLIFVLLVIFSLFISILIFLSCFFLLLLLLFPLVSTFSSSIYFRQSVLSNFGLCLNRFHFHQKVLWTSQNAGGHCTFVPHRVSHNAISN